MKEFGNRVVSQLQLVFAQFNNALLIIIVVVVVVAANTTTTTATFFLTRDCASMATVPPAPSTIAHGGSPPPTGPTHLRRRRIAQVTMVSGAGDWQLDLHSAGTMVAISSTRPSSSKMTRRFGVNPTEESVPEEKATL